MSRKTNVKGLAFTYSGGYRMIPAQVALRTIESFEGKRIRCNKSPIAAETMIAVNAVPVQIELEQINEAVDAGEIDGGESTYPRYYGLKQNEHCNIINDAEHSLFLTSIIVQKQFWEQIPDELKAKIEVAALDAAQAERKESIEDIDTVKARAAEDSIEVITMSPEERARFKEATAYIAPKFAGMFSDGLVAAISSTA